VARLAQPSTVGDLARRARRSSRQLTRQFVATAGTTPPQSLLTRRIHLAGELLEQTDGNLDHSAFAVGIGAAATARRRVNRIVGVARRGLVVPPRPTDHADPGSGCGAKVARPPSDHSVL
jgi:transcriptional regulator GlxA family with amidase domain